MDSDPVRHTNAMPLEFVLVVMYFLSLHRFKVFPCRDHSVVWEKEKESSKALDFQKAYRVIKRVNNGEVDGIRLYDSVEKNAIQTKRIMYATLMCFFLLLASVLTLTFIDPMK